MTDWLSEKWQDYGLFIIAIVAAKVLMFGFMMVNAIFSGATAFNFARRMSPKKCFATRSNR